MRVCRFRIRLKEILWKLNALIAEKKNMKYTTELEEEGRTFKSFVFAVTVKKYLSHFMLLIGFAKRAKKLLFFYKLLLTNQFRRGIIVMGIRRLASERLEPNSRSLPPYAIFSILLAVFLLHFIFLKPTLHSFILPISSIHLSSPQTPDQNSPYGALFLLKVKNLTPIPIFFSLDNFKKICYDKNKKTFFQAPYFQQKSHIQI